MPLSLFETSSIILSEKPVNDFSRQKKKVDQVSTSFPLHMRDSLPWAMVFIAVTLDCQPKVIFAVDDSRLLPELETSRSTPRSVTVTWYQTVMPRRNFVRVCPETCIAKNWNRTGSVYWTERTAGEIRDSCLWKSLKWNLFIWLHRFVTDKI